MQGVRTINQFQKELYRLYDRPDDFRGIIYPGVGHAFTPDMWHEVMPWLERKLARKQ